jgi:hypothetical protein
MIAANGCAVRNARGELEKLQQTNDGMMMN